VIDVITLDFETYYDTSISLTKLTTMDYVDHEMFKVWGVGIKVNDEKTQWFGEDETADALNEIDWDKAKLVCHNTPFDGYILTQHYKLIPKYYIDTAAMCRGMFPGQSARLKDCAIRLFPNDATMRKGDELVNAKGIYDLPPDIEKQIAGYCIQDVDLTYAIFQKLTETFPNDEMDIIDLTTRMFCEPKLKIDRERLIKYHEQEFNNSEKKIKDSGVEKTILSSNKQFAQYIEEELDIVVPTKKSPTTGNPIPALGKNDAAFKQMCDRYPEYQHIWTGRTAVKSRLTETRSKRFLDAARADDTIPVPLRYYAAHTGRFGGTEKLNMQNLPRGGEIRQCLIAPDNHYLYVADLSNIEARMLAWLAGESALVEQFRKGDDIYSNFASKIYDRPINKKDNPIERFVGKTAILGLGYGMGHKKFRDTLKAGAMGPSIDFSETEAKEVVNTYRATYPKIKLLWTKLEDLLLQGLHRDNYGNKYGPLEVIPHGLKLPNGMALKYQNLDSTPQGLMYESRGRKEFTYGGRITENVIQALSRIVITDSVLRLSKRKELDVVLQVHDEIIIIANNMQPHVTMSYIIDDMCLAPKWCQDIPLDAEGGFATNYSK